MQEIPNGAMSLHSPFYLSRAAVEEKAYAAIAKPGGLLLLRAPQKMGKSTLMLRLFHHALALNYQPIQLDFQLADHMVLAHPDRFLRWFCAHASRSLGLAPRLDEFWHTASSSKIRCLNYLQNYLLQQIDRPVVILCNEVNRIFDYPLVTQEFLPLMQSFCMIANHSQFLQKLRLVVAYSTEIDLPSQLTQPHNNSCVIDLPEFTLSEIQTLASRYGINWMTNQVHDALALYHLVGGHPYLVQLAFHHLKQHITDSGQVTSALMQLLKTAPSLSGIYKEHFQHHFSVLYGHPELATALQQVLLAEGGAKLSATPARKLRSLGLIKLVDDHAVISYPLYRQLYQRYFSPNSFSKLASDSNLSKQS